MTISLQLKYLRRNVLTSKVLRAILPSNLEVPSSYEQVGHIVHLNLDASLLPFKYVIGQVYLDKIPSCKTVVNKIGRILSPWRTFDMEVIAGEDNTVVEVKEGNCTFSFDYRKVYWNSRLHHEHRRLVNSFSNTDCVVDMFCGVGPFAIPAAKRGCHVYANDLNPSCIESLKRNCITNHVNSNYCNHHQVSDRVIPFQLDARDFISQLTSKQIPLHQIIMNLPVSAESFCDVFESCFSVRAD